jgi:hypothetical protein
MQNPGSVPNAGVWSHVYLPQKSEAGKGKVGPGTRGILKDSVQRIRTTRVMVPSYAHTSRCTERRQRTLQTSSDQLGSYHSNDYSKDEALCAFTTPYAIEACDANTGVTWPLYTSVDGNSPQLG